MLRDWLNNLPPVFQPMRSKSNAVAPWAHDFCCALSKLQVFAWNFDWLIVLFALFIHRSNYCGSDFSTIIWKPYAMTNFISCFSYQVISTVDVRNLRFTVSSCAISTTTRNYFFQQQREKTSWLITAFIPYVRWNAVPVSVYSPWALTIFCEITTRTKKQN